jgi:hypothetical protein
MKQTARFTLNKTNTQLGVVSFIILYYFFTKVEKRGSEGVDGEEARNTNSDEGGHPHS